MKTDLKIFNQKLIFIYFVFGSLVVSAEVIRDENLKIKYKKGRDVDFEALLIEGQKRSEEISYIGGDLGVLDKSLLKNVKDNFITEMQIEGGIPQ
jgi:hypothetical protein